ncbi:MAG: GNAT family N-acetyltransferase, partial [Bacilli bacterium]|nr:GNAT family N-acetyltransferase [Bacilli bacterium]
DSLEWKSYFENYYEDNVKIHQRVLFDSSLLTLEKTREYKTNLPEELRIVKIEKEHVASGLIFQDVTSRFFTASDFIEHGFGFALVDKNNICQGFALTNYPVIGKEVELYFRIGYEDYPKYRQKGLGTLLCSYFIEYCLLNGYTPVWDAANDISSHIAHKFGYIPEEKWYMYHVIKKVSKTKE